MDPDTTAPHIVIDPAILYLGTPVALISTTGPDGAPNLMPLSSSLFLGKTGVLGLGTRSQTAANLLDSGECVINFAPRELAASVDALALTTGRRPVPAAKAAAGYRHVRDKFTLAGLTPVASDLVAPVRVAQCPIALEARLVRSYPLAEDDPAEAGGAVACEVRVLRTHVHEAVRAPGYANRVDPLRWHPLLMSFQRYFSVGEEVRSSRLSAIDEEWYR